MEIPSIENIFQGILAREFLLFLVGVTLITLLLACAHRFFQYIHISIEKEIAQKKSKGEFVFVQMIDSIGAGLATMLLITLRFLLPFLFLWIAIRWNLLSGSIVIALVRGLIILYVALSVFNWSFSHISVSMDKYMQVIRRIRQSYTSEDKD